MGKIRAQWYTAATGVAVAARARVVEVALCRVICRLSRGLYLSRVLDGGDINRAELLLCRHPVCVCARSGALSRRRKNTRKTHADGGEPFRLGLNGRAIRPIFATLRRRRARNREAEYRTLQHFLSSPFTRHLARNLRPPCWLPN